MCPFKTPNLYVTCSSDTPTKIDINRNFVVVVSAYFYNEPPRDDQEQFFEGIVGDFLFFW